MNTIGMPAGMWLLFAGSFRKQLIETLGYDAIRAREITGKEFAPDDFLDYLEEK